MKSDDLITLPNYEPQWVRPGPSGYVSFGENTVSLSCPAATQPEAFEALAVSVLVAVVLLWIVMFARLQHWKTLYENERRERTGDTSNDGWIEEARFWRRHFNSDAAAWVEGNVALAAEAETKS